MFFHRREGSWSIALPWRPDALYRHLIGKLPESLGLTEARALGETVLRRQVQGFAYSSTEGAIIGEGDDALINLYCPPTLEPRKGSFSRVQDIIQVLTAGDQAVAQWLVHWCAALVQRPERRSMVAVLVLSPQQGIGKSMFGNILKEIIGPGNATVTSTRALRDSFNASFVTKLLVLADEVGIKRRDQDVIADLKAYITDDRVHCATPYAPRIDVDNRMSWWMTSNEMQPLLIEEDDRRFTVLQCGHADPHYRDMLKDCFSPRNGTWTDSFLREIEGFAHALHALAVDYKLIARPCSSAAKRDLQGVSLPTILAYIRELQKAGALAMLSAYPPGDNAVYRVAPSDTTVPTAALYQSYRTFCEQHGERDIKPEGPFRLSVKKMPGIALRTVTSAGQRVRVYTGFAVPAKQQSNVINIT